MSRVVLLAIVFALLGMGFNAGFLTAELVSVGYVIVYDLRENAGMLTVYLNFTGLDCAIYRVPINIFDDREVNIEFLNYTAQGTNILGVEYGNGLAEMASCGSGSVELYFEVSGLLEELGAGSYSLIVDTSQLANVADVSLVLMFGTPVEIDVQRAGGLEVLVKDENRGVLSLRGAGLATISLAVAFDTVVAEEVATANQRQTIPLMYIAFLSIAIVATTLLVVIVKRRK